MSGHDKNGGQHAASGIAAADRLGTFAGVFAPSVLTILGLILFLRLGYVVGSAGLAQALVIIIVAHSISILTSVSLSAVATNLKVKGGGVYYIISRTLGLPFGGAIGVVLYIAQAVSVGFYCVGFAEGVAALAGTKSPWLMEAIAAAAVVAMLALAWLGADWATRFQYVVMVLIAGAVLSFAVGAFTHWNGATLSANLHSPGGWGNFWVMFAIFFPAVTGFTQGVNMSGDLKDPGRSIPFGTALAVGSGLFVYLAVAVLCAGAIPRTSLIGDYGAMKTVAPVAAFVDAGIISATLSSALASFLGAPRILQSLARDRIFPALLPFSQGYGPSNNPRRAVLLTGAIALSIVALGDLNLIAAIVSMFFVITYGLLNYATYFESRGRSPSFRPTLKWYDERLSLVGGLSALGVMLAIDFRAGLVAMAVVFAIYSYLMRSAIAARWADGQRSYNLQVAREHLLKANMRIEHPRDWRPQILAFSSASERRDRLLTFAHWIEGRSGLTTIVKVLVGKGRQLRRARKEAEEALDKEIRKHHHEAFPLVVFGPDLGSAVQAVVQSSGIGPFRINTVLINWVEEKSIAGDSPEAKQFCRNIHAPFLLGRNVLVLDAEEREWSDLLAREPSERVIDVWWSDNATGQLMLILAYLLTRNDEWQDARIRVLPLAAADEHDAVKARVAAMLSKVRIAAEIEIVPDDETGSEQIAARSGSSSIVFQEMRFAQGNIVDRFGNDLGALLPQLPVVVLAMAAEEVDLAADPDEGEESQRAQAKDALEDAAGKHAQIAAALAEQRNEIEKAHVDFRQLDAERPDDESLAKKRRRLLELEAHAWQLSRQLDEATRQLSLAQQSADELGISGILPGEDEEMPAAATKTQPGS